MIIDTIHFTTYNVHFTTINDYNVHFTTINDYYY